MSLSTNLQHCFVIFPCQLIYNFFCTLYYSIEKYLICVFDSCGWRIDLWIFQGKYAIKLLSNLLQTQWIFVENSRNDLNSDNLYWRHKNVYATKYVVSTYWTEYRMAISWFIMEWMNNKNTIANKARAQLWFRMKKSLFWI